MRNWEKCEVMRRTLVNVRFRFLLEKQLERELYKLYEMGIIAICPGKRYKLTPAAEKAQMEPPMNQEQFIHALLEGSIFVLMWLVIYVAFSDLIPPLPWLIPSLFVGTIVLILRGIND